jgi:hypothetical protein
MKQIIRAVPEQKERTGTFDGFTFVGWEYEEGWLVSIASVGDESAQNLWADGTFVAPRFSAVAPGSLNGLGRTEVDAEPIEVTSEVKAAVLAMIWEWEIWEPITVAGTCAIDSLVRMLDLPQNTLLAWFRTAGRNPSVPEQIVHTLEENGYAVDIAGPEGLGGSTSIVAWWPCIARTIRRMAMSFSSTNSTRRSLMPQGFNHPAATQLCRCVPKSSISSSTTSPIFKY